MKVTQYGYSDDPYSDSYTEKGLGKWHKLEPGVSAALTDSAAKQLGVKPGDWVKVEYKNKGEPRSGATTTAPLSAISAWTSTTPVGS